MRSTWAIFVAACGLAGVPAASSEVIEVDLGSFLFGFETTPYEYVGDHADLMGHDIEGDPIEKSVATVDLSRLVELHPGTSIAWIRISDPGGNLYGANPGADVDLFSVAGLPDEVDVTYSYSGSNILYAETTSEELAVEVASVDFDYGSNDASALWVSLGEHGSLTMTFGGWPDAGSDGDDDDVDAESGDVSEFSGRADLSNLQLRLNEIAPTGEWVTVSIGLEDEPIAAGDLNADGMVDAADLGMLFTAWGVCEGCPADMNGDGLVNAEDLGLLVAVWTA